MNWYTAIYLFLGVLLTGSITLAFRKRIQPLLKSITTIGVAFVLGLLCLHILPEVFHQETSIRIGAFVLIGFIIQLFLELLSKGIEHGHVHHDNHNHNHGQSTFLKSNTKFIALLIGLSIHSLIEGIPLSGDFSEVGHHHHGHEHTPITNDFTWVFFWSIIAHKLPVAIVLSLFMLDNHFTKVKFFIYLSIFALMTPLGGIIGHYANDAGWLSIQNYLLAITSGMLLHITTLLIFEDYHSNKDKLINLIFISLGIAISLLLF